MVKFVSWLKGPLLAILPYVCCGVLIVGAYWLGGHTQRTKDQAVDAAVSNVAGQLQKQMSDLTNGMVGNINQSLSEGMNRALTTYQLNQARIDAERDTFTLSPDAGVLVQGPVSTGTQTGPVNPDAGGPGSNGTEYRARLSATSEAFLRGEAYRADQAATDLILTKDTIRSWQRAVNDYNRTVADANKLPRVQLPVDMSGTAYKK